MALNDDFTSTGAKLFHHQEAMQKLRDHKGMPIVSHVIPTDLCNHSCAFCSVLTREGDSLTISQIDTYLDQLVPLGLKAVIISGGGNPILYRCKETGANFDTLVNLIHSKQLEIGLITNGMKLKQYSGGRKSWLTVKPETLDKCTWIRISMAGLDHKEQEVYVPDVNRGPTTLGFSYVYHDVYHDQMEPNHGKVSSPYDLVGDAIAVEFGRDRLPWLHEKIAEYVDIYSPAYVRLLPNCLEVDQIESRCTELQKVADGINPNVVFVQYKPPKAPNACYLGYIHPVLNSDGFVYPCDSCVLNTSAGHKFAEQWRISSWDKVSELYTKPFGSLVDSKKLCPGCVFTKTNGLLERVVNGMETPLPSTIPVHLNFV